MFCMATLAIHYDQQEQEICQLLLVIHIALDRSILLLILVHSDRFPFPVCEMKLAEVLSVHLSIMIRIKVSHLEIGRAHV